MRELAIPSGAAANVDERTVSRYTVFRQPELVIYSQTVQHCYGIADNLQLIGNKRSRPEAAIQFINNVPCRGEAGMTAVLDEDFM